MEPACSVKHNYMSADTQMINIYVLERQRAANSSVHQDQQGKKSQSGRDCSKLATTRLRWQLPSCHARMLVQSHQNQKSRFLKI